MKKRTITVLVVALVWTFSTACSKEIDTMTESANEKKSSVIENPTVSQDTTEIVFPEQFEALSGYDEEVLVDYLKENSDGNYQKIECIGGQVNMVATQEEMQHQDHLYQVLLICQYHEELHLLLRYHHLLHKY